MTTIQKEYLVLAYHFYNEWKGSSKVQKHSKLSEMIKALNLDIKKEIDKREIPSLLESAYKKMIKVVANKEVVANSLILSIGSLMLLIEDNYFKGSRDMAIKRLTNDIYKDIEKVESGTQSFRDANMIISKLDELNRS